MNIYFNDMAYIISLCCIAFYCNRTNDSRWLIMVLLASAIYIYWTHYISDNLLFIETEDDDYV